MQIISFAVVLLSWCLFSAPVSGASANPIAKVVELLTKLQQEVIEAGQQEQKMYNQFSELCSDKSRQLHHEIKIGKDYATELTATIEKATAERAVVQTQIDSAADGLADAEADVEKATAMREKESSDFKAGEEELLKTISTIERAITVTEREGQEASFAQEKNMQSITELLQAMVEASTVDSYNVEALTALVQSSSQKSSRVSEDSEEDDTGAPSAAPYEDKSSPIAETLEMLLDKSKSQLDEARQAEVQEKNTYALVKQSLDAKINTFTKAMGQAKKDLAATKESKAGAEGGLTVTKKDLAADEEDLRELHHECLDKANSFEDAATSRDEELKALSSAKGFIIEATGGAKTQTSFLQVGSKGLSDDALRTASDASHMVNRLALTLNSQALMQLSNHLTKTIQRSALTGASPFGQVRRMLNSMISKLQAEADAATTKKAYCDKAMGETEANKEHKDDSIDQLTTQLDIMKANSRKLKERVATLKTELGALFKTEAEMTQMRIAERAAYAKNKPEVEQGLEGIKNALTVLRDYYGTGVFKKADGKSHDASYGAAGGLVSMLEVIESDLVKGIAEMTTAGESSQAEYITVSKQNQILRATKEKDAEHLTAERTSLDKSITEIMTDKAGTEDERDAIVQYFRSIKKECIAAPDAYETIKNLRGQEIAGLQEALRTLQNEGTMLLQLGTRHKSLRRGAAQIAASA